MSKFTNFYYYGFSNRNQVHKPTQKSLLQTLNLVKPDTGRGLYAKTVKGHLIPSAEIDTTLRTAEFSSDEEDANGSLQDKFLAEVHSSKDHALEVVSAKKARREAQVGEYQTKLTKLWTALLETERDNWIKAAQSSNAEAEDTNDGAEYITRWVGEFSSSLQGDNIPSAIKAWYPLP